MTISLGCVTALVIGVIEGAILAVVAKGFLKSMGFRRVTVLRTVRCIFAGALTLSLVVFLKMGR